MGFKLIAVLMLFAGVGIMSVETHGIRVKVPSVESRYLRRVDPDGFCVHHREFDDGSYMTLVVMNVPDVPVDAADAEAMLRHDSRWRAKEFRRLPWGASEVVAFSSDAGKHRGIQYRLLVAEIPVQPKPVALTVAVSDQHIDEGWILLTNAVASVESLEPVTGIPRKAVASWSAPSVLVAGMATVLVVICVALLRLSRRPRG